MNKNDENSFIGGGSPPPGGYNQSMIEEMTRKYQQKLNHGPQRDYLKTDDINNKNTDTRRYTSMHVATRQSTNPLDPQYNYPGFKQMQE